jgi:hypothetical protein
MSRNTCLMASIVMGAIAVVLTGTVRADDQAANGQDPVKDLPAAVLEAAQYHVPDLCIEEVSTRQVQGHPLMYIIEGDACNRGVVLSIEENGDVHEIRFHKPMVGVKPTKITHAIEELPDVVRDTAERVVPDIQISEVKSTRAEGQERQYHLVGMVLADDQARHVTLTIEEDGDLLEARVYKPIKEVASVEETNPADPNVDPNAD